MLVRGLETDVLAHGYKCEQVVNTTGESDLYNKTPKFLAYTYHKSIILLQRVLPYTLK